MTPEAQRAAAAELRAIALDLGAAQDRIHALAGLLKDPNRVTYSYVEATTAAFHAFSALKAANALAGRLDPTPLRVMGEFVVVDVPEPPEAA